MACIATNTTDDIGSEIALFRAVIFAMADLTTCLIFSVCSEQSWVFALTILASLILIITKRTVESSKLTELIALQLVLTFGDGGGLVYIS